jgi:hypothetical protein
LLLKPICRKNAFSTEQLSVLKTAYDKGLRQFGSAAEKQKLMEVALKANLELQQVKVYRI